MNRRSFLLSLLSPAAALIVAPELLLPHKTFFLPPVGGWGANMTATEVQALFAAAYRAAFPPIVMGKFSEDFAVWGRAALRLEPGSIQYANVRLAEVLMPSLRFNLKPLELT